MVHIIDYFGATLLLISLSLMRYRWAWIVYSVACMVYFVVGILSGYIGLIVVEVIAAILGIRNYIKWRK